MQCTHVYRYLSRAGIIPPADQGQMIQREYHRVSGGIVRVTIDYSEPATSEGWASVEYASDDDMLSDYEPQNKAPQATRWQGLDVRGLRAATADG